MVEEPFRHTFARNESSSKLIHAHACTSEEYRAESCGLRELTRPDPEPHLTIRTFLDWAGVFEL